MGMPDEIKDMLVGTKSIQMHYLTDGELVLARNFPPYLDELIQARCGTRPDLQAELAKRLSWRSCEKEVLKEKMTAGGRDYLKAYGGTQQ
jgi:hypothetical protein